MDGGNGNRKTLEGVSFSLQPGEKLALVGRTGAGKSTLVHLLPRLFDVTEGQILIDGVDIRSLPLQQIRKAIGFVPQDPFLFSSRIDDNIAFAVDDDELHDADAVDEAIDESLEELIEGAEMIGEDGEPFVDVYGEPGDSFLTAPPPGADVYEEEIDPELEAVEPEQP
ncbi:MAG TPA: ABC transporter ATP-binding protein [Lacipirellulaceae bacterium]|nr:ABC transporter ATP-binding protein [Lacipirellulaceae bacterium]